MIESPKHIVISRTDSIGDVALTLPLSGILKQCFPDTKVSFLINSYTKPLALACDTIDDIWEWNQIETIPDSEKVHFFRQKNIDVFIHVFPRKQIAKIIKAAGIPHRIGTSHRLFHFLTCNHRLNFSRKNSDLHESQLNAKLLSPLGIQESFSLNTLTQYVSLGKIGPLPDRFKQLLPVGKKVLILHPKSQGSAREWAIENYVELSLKVDSSKYTVIFTGTEKEGQIFRHLIPTQSNIIDLTGQLSLSELISLIQSADFLIAASTGPLHIAGLTGIQAIGLFSTKRPTHAGRWQPLGNKVQIIEEKIFSDETQPLNIPLRDVIKALE